jgi:hypothetical protein
MEMKKILSKYAPTSNYILLTSGKDSLKTKGSFAIRFGGNQETSIKIEWIHNSNRCSCEVAFTSSPFFESALREGEYLGKGVHERVTYVKNRGPIPGKRMTFYGGHNYYYATNEKEAAEIYKFILNIFGDGSNS